MNINKNNFLGNFDATFLTDVLKTSMTIYNKGEALISDIVGYVNGTVPYTNDEGYMILDQLEEFVQTDISSLVKFYDGRTSGYFDLNRRLKDVIKNFYRVKDVVDPLLDEFVPLTLNELKGVLKYTKAMVGHLCVFVRKQYEFADYLNGGKCEFSLEVYMHDNNLTKEDINNLDIKMAARAIAYRPKIAVFEQYPDLEQPFFDKVGEEFYDLEFINVKHVLDIINDVISPEDLLKELYEN